MRAPSRRQLLASGAAAAVVGGATLLTGKNGKPAHAGRRERRAIPTACLQCASRCPILGVVEEGRLVKIEGNPASLATRGRICAKGQAGLNQVDNPDRLLFPIVREGARGEGKWRRISWAAALDLLVEGGEIAGRRVRGLRALREAGTPERFLFHYGRTVGSDWAILMEHFLPSYGTASVGNHDSICMAAADVAGELTGGGWAFRDFSKAAFILSFGSSNLEAGLDHVPVSQRCVDALARGVPMVTFDARLSNTAAKSSRWIPIVPGTDLAVALAMCHTLLSEGLHDAAFVAEHTNVTVRELEAHLASYTPEWAAGVSGVPAETIRSVAIEYATKKPSICLSARGAFMHHNGVATQRAIMLLAALAGNVDPLGRKARGVRWAYRPAPPPATGRLPIFDGEPGRYPQPLDNVSHQILRMIDEGPDRPDVYMLHCHNPVYSNGDCRANARVLSDVAKIPFLVAVDVGLSETSMLADLVLPDATYLERWTLDGRTTPEGVAEYQLRQPMHAPLGEARQFSTVACEIAARLGLDLGFSSAEEFVRAACEATPGVREAGGFAHMKAHGVWADPAPLEYGPPPAPMRVRSEELAKAGFDALPSWMAAPEHEAMAEDQLILVTYKLPFQTQSRTQGCKWLTELQPENFAWIHPVTAAARGLADGDRALVRSEIGEIAIRVKVTEGVHPRAVAISHHGGHWAQGEYASGKPSPFQRREADTPLRWWTEHGAHVNLLIPTKGDPIGGAMCWNDTLVRVAKEAQGESASRHDDLHRVVSVSR